ncbi:Hypothetical protein LUCI_2679 [Lucifera butyrica]|uniref:HD-GYP domain-containing protein n=1 Tax=Lucifera butyrica TaxID=1351585 RepID=A0A498R928_9FIRM|nr:HD-GYP domain-containing protein [Lucifera butyrica]VBB07430.1 Hypothetical protein LUCI_2679 [Lucifera butyrica]
MQRISIDALIPGMVTARDIFSAEGRILLGRGVLLTQRYIQRLRELGIYSVYIQSSLAADVVIPEVIREETRIKAIKQVKEAFEKFRGGFHHDFSKLNAVARNIVDEILQHGEHMVHLTDIRQYDEYTFGHSVNVCILSVLTGVKLDYPYGRLRELALGALLHDIGKLGIPNEILNKQGTLTAAEMELLQKHPDMGFDMLRRNPDLQILSAHVAYQHHERMDGSGYPRRLAGDDIHEFARIAAIADVYDALTADRAYRKALPPHKAYEILMATAEKHFDPDILHVFLSNIALYPVGSIVKLNTGETGVVLKVTPVCQERPLIYIVTDADGYFVPKGKEVDLAQYPELFISKIFKMEEVLDLLQKLHTFDSKKHFNG